MIIHEDRFIEVTQEDLECAKFIEGTREDLEIAMGAGNIIVGMKATRDEARGVTRFEVDWTTEAYLEQFIKRLEERDAKVAADALGLAFYDDDEDGVLEYLADESDLVLDGAEAVAESGWSGVWRVTTPSDPYTEYALVYLGGYALDSNNFEPVYRR